MSNIDLNLVSDKSQVEMPKLFSGSLIFSLSVVVFVVFVYGGLWLYNKKLTDDLKKVQYEYEVGFKSFLGDNTGKVVYFANRSAIASNLISEDISVVSLFSEIEKSILTNVRLESLSYEKETKTVKLSCVGDNFNTLARQVLGFKESGYFSGVIPGSSAIEMKDSAKLNFEIELKIK